MARRMRRGRSAVESRPWSSEEDSKLAEVCSIGLASDYWHLALPDRPFGDIANRRLELGLKMAPLL